MRFNSPARFACVIFFFAMTLLSAEARVDRDEVRPEKINLALRRAADQLLRASGDFTSRIPAVEQVNDSTWRLQLRQSIQYDTLPYILQASFEQHGIKLSYDVTVRRCEDEVIDLGYQQQDFLQDSMVPCLGREEPTGCHYIEVIFTGGNLPKTFWAGKNYLLLFLVIGGVICFWWFTKRKGPIDSSLSEEDSDWLPFGQSRLHVTSHIVECSGVHHQLTYREAKLLRLFATHPDQLLEREIILRQVWADEGVQVGRSIDMFVSRLRKKLKADPTVGIVAVHGLGYRLETRKEMAG